MKKKKPTYIESFENLKFVGNVEGKKAYYSVFESSGDYYLISFRDGRGESGYFTKVLSDSIDKVNKAFRGRTRITVSNILENPKMSRLFDRFVVLDILYVMAALGEANVDKRSPNAKSLYFNIRN